MASTFEARRATETPLRSKGLPMTTRAGDGLSRRRWTTAELDAMVEAQIIVPDERFELIEGDVVMMAAKGIRHEMLKTELSRFWATKLNRPFRMACATTFMQTEDTYFESDFVFFDPGTKKLELTPAQSRLVVEIADHSLEYDLGRKAGFYAAYGIRELWVMNADSLETHVHREPGQSGYRKKFVVPPDEALNLPFAPHVSVKLGELGSVNP
jgi:Uma2 family endonuclease